MFKIKYIDIDSNTNEVIEREVLVNNTAFYMRVNEDRTMYDNEYYILSCELMDTYIKPEKKPEKVFTINALKEWANKKKNVKCRVKNCNKIGFHSGDFCGIHFIQIKKALSEKGLSWAKFQERLNKKGKCNE